MACRGRRGRGQWGLFPSSPSRQRHFPAQAAAPCLRSEHLDLSEREVGVLAAHAGKERVKSRGPHRFFSTCEGANRPGQDRLWISREPQATEGGMQAETDALKKTFINKTTPLLYVRRP